MNAYIPGLEQYQFRLIASGGFGDPLNSYAHTMAWFCERLYVGTTRANLCLLKMHMPIDFLCWPVKCPADVYDPVSYTHLRAHETPEHLVCRLLLEKKKTTPH